MATIVFCEDQEQIRKLIQIAMRSTPHHVEVAADGQAGLEAIRRLAPDLIVTDLAMPRMSGFALADAVRADAELRHMPILFMTASVQRGDVEQFALHGGNGYIAKPFSPRALREEIDKVIAVRVP